MGNKAKWFFPATLLAVTVLASVALLGVFFSASADTGESVEDNPVNKIAWSTVESKLVARHTIEYIETPVTTIKYVDRVTAEPVQLRNFHDLKELKEWLSGSWTLLTLHLQSPDNAVDCDDYALALQQRALEDGFIMSFEIIAGDEYNALFGNPLPPGQSLHAINLAIIGNSAYYIEPQTGEIVFAVYLD